MSRPAGAVGLLVVVGAALRLLGLDAKGFWQDEVATLEVLRADLGGLPPAITDSERAPPLYYLIAWPWTRVFGDGEVGIRSLSALSGVAVIPVAYLAGKELVSRRAGVVAAGLVAVNPLLVWYSQEARVYSLLVLLSGVALYFFARSLKDPRPWPLALWALFSVLAVMTHYFAAFAFAAEAAWLLARAGRRRAVLAASAVPAAAVVALIPLAAAQQGPRAATDWILDLSLPTRVAELGLLLVGVELTHPLALPLGGIAATLAGVGLLLLLTRGSEAERRGALVAGSVAAGTILIPLALVPVGIDVFLYRNMLGVGLALVVVVAAGLGAARAGAIGLAATAALMALSAGIVVATNQDPKYQREAWREAAESLGASRWSRAIVSTPGQPGEGPLRLVYLSDTSRLEGGSAWVEEVDLLALPRRGYGELAAPKLPRVDDRPSPPSPGFTLVERRREEYLLLYRYRAARPWLISYEQLSAAALDQGVEPLVLIQRPGVR